MAAMKPIVIDAVTKHTATVIVAHGLGDSGAGWVFLADTWRRKNKFPEVKFIFPNAPTIPITLNMGYRMPGWYDIVRQRNPNSVRSLESLATRPTPHTRTNPVDIGIARRASEGRRRVRYYTLASILPRPHQR